MHDIADIEKIINFNQIKIAQDRINGFIRKTPLEKSDFFSKIAECEVYMKLENTQVTNSFKIRGALNKMLKLNDEEKRNGILAISSGNHAQGIGYGARLLKVKATIIVPENTPKIKIDAIKKYDVDLKILGKNYFEAEIIAREFEKKTGMTYISPYNDADVIAGQGTIGLEILNDKPDIDTIIAPVGGGGLISGVAIIAKSINPKIKIIGVQSYASPIMYESIKAGKIIEMEVNESIAEGLHGGIEKDTITFELIRKYVDNILLVSEDEIKNAIRLFIINNNQLIEGSGAVGLAALLKYKSEFKNRKVAVIISGGNLDSDKIKI